MRKLTFLVLILVLAGVVVANGAWAYTHFIPDTTKVRSYRNLAPFTWHMAEWHDVIGEPGGGTPFKDGFNVSNLEVTWLGADVHFKFFTNFPAGGLTVGGYDSGVADLFIDRKRDGGAIGFSSPGYDAVIKMSGPDVGKVYDDTAPWVVRSSHYFFGNTGLVYGGEYDKAAGRTPEVDFSGSNQIGTAAVAWTGAGPYVITIDLLGINTAGDWDKFNFVWNVAHCANESISGAAYIPVPAPLWLVGSGLLGLWAFRKRRAG